AVRRHELADLASGCRYHEDTGTNAGDGPVEGDGSTVRRKSRQDVRQGGGQRESLLESALDVQQEDPETFARRRAIHYGQRAPVARPREPQHSSALHLPELPLGSAGGRDETHLGAPTGLLTEKRDLGAVGRPGGAPVPRGIGGQPEWLLRADRLDVDVVIVLALAIPRESNE